MYSLVIPVYRNEEFIPELLEVLGGLDDELNGRLEVVFVVDGSPDRSFEKLEAGLANCRFPSQLIALSRNFGSFAAIRTGLERATGPLFAVMAADLQEPPELVVEFFRVLESEQADVAVGTRASRDDPMLQQLASRAYWGLYRRLVQREMPAGGVDVFGCNQVVRDRLVALEESNSSFVGLLFWVGFRTQSIPYHRLQRREGKSGWTWSRRLRYFSDSVFAFSDLPIRLLLVVGGLGLVVSTVFGAIVLAARIGGGIEVPGYAATVLVMTFFGALNMLGLGIIGSYVWRAFENTKRRPGAIVMSHRRIAGRQSGA